MKFLILSFILGNSLWAQTPMSPQSERFFSNTEAQASGGLANTLLAMSVASMGTAMPSTCLTSSGGPLPQSVILFAMASDNYARAEVVAVTEHKRNLEERLADVRALAARMKVQGGGEVQRRTLQEILIEQLALRDYITMKIGWLDAAKAGFVSAGSFAATEASDGSNPDFTVNCTGTYPASVPVAEAFGEAYSLFGAENKIAEFLPRVLPIAVADLLTLTTLPDQRIILASIAGASMDNVRAELQAALSTIDTNVSNTNQVIAQLDLEEGVDIRSGVNRDGETPTPAGEEFFASAPTSPQSSAGASFAPVIGGVSAAAPVKVIPSGSCLSISKACTSPVSFSQTAIKTSNPTVKSVSEASVNFSNALVRGDIVAANLAAGVMTSLATRAEATRLNGLRSVNQMRIQKAKPMLDAESDSKKSYARIKNAIEAEIAKTNPVIQVASASPPAATLSPVIKSAKPDSPVSESGFSSRLSAPKYEALSPEQKQILRGEKEAETVAKADAPGPSLWEKISDRYRANYGRFFEKKTAPRP